MIIKALLFAFADYHHERLIKKKFIADIYDVSFQAQTVGEFIEEIPSLFFFCKYDMPINILEERGHNFTDEKERYTVLATHNAYAIGYLRSSTIYPLVHNYLIEN